MRWDVFISHASEDKETFVRALADELRRAGLAVWYDDFSLRAGDSLRETIDRGISDSRLGIVVLSSNFFRKNWPQNELNGLFTIATSQGRKLIPIWLDVTANDVTRFSPMLADRVALRADQGVDMMVDEVRGLVAAEKLRRINRDVYLYTVEIGGAVRDIVSPIPADWLFHHGYGLPSIAIFGVLVWPIHKGGDFVPDNFRENLRFVRFLHTLITTSIFDDDGSSRLAETERAGWMCVIDQRTPTPGGKIPAVDILGAVKITDGLLVPDSYERNYYHQLLTEDGFFLLAEQFESRMMHEIRTVTAQQDDMTLDVEFGERLE